MCVSRAVATEFTIMLIHGCPRRPLLPDQQDSWWSRSFLHSIRRQLFFQDWSCVCGNTGKLLFVVSFDYICLFLSVAHWKYFSVGLILFLEKRLLWCVLEECWRGWRSFLVVFTRQRSHQQRRNRRAANGDINEKGSSSSCVCPAEPTEFFGGSFKRQKKDKRRPQWLRSSQSICNSNWRASNKTKDARFLSLWVCLSAKFSNLRAKNNANIVLVGILNLAHLIDVGQSLAPNHFVVYNELLSGIYNTLNNNTVPHNNTGARASH